MNLTASDLSYTSQFPFEFAAATPGNGSIKLSGKAGPLNQTDAAQTPVDTSLEIRSLDLTLTGFVDPSSGIAGVLDFPEPSPPTASRLTRREKSPPANSSWSRRLSRRAAAGGGLRHHLRAQAPDRFAEAGRRAHRQSRRALSPGRLNNSGETPSVAMKLTGTDMPASDLESVLPAVGSRPCLRARPSKRAP